MCLGVCVFLNVPTGPCWTVQYVGLVSKSVETLQRYWESSTMFLSSSHDSILGSITAWPPSQSPQIEDGGMRQELVPASICTNVRK